MKNKRILIILSGGTSSGKTTTLNSVIDTLRDKYPTAKIDYLNRNTNLNNTKNGGDRRVILSDIGDSKLKIGINTAGDGGYAVKKSMELFDNHHCDIVICPTKSSIKTKNGSISTIQNEIINRKDSIQVIPIFKVMFKYHDLKLNDDFIRDVILNQLNNFIK